MVSAVADSYARAFEEVAFEAGQVDRLGRELADFLTMVESSRELHDLLINPAFSFEDKRKVVEAISEKAGLSRSVVNFLLTILERGRAGQLRQIAEAFRDRVDRRRGILRGEVYSAREVTQGVRQRLEDALETLVGNKLKLEYKLDGSLIAGLRVKIGSVVYDGSVSTQLDEIRKRLSSQHI